MCTQIPFHHIALYNKTGIVPKIVARMAIFMCLLEVVGWRQCFYKFPCRMISFLVFHSLNLRASSIHDARRAMILIDRAGIHGVQSDRSQVERQAQSWA